MTEPNPKCKCMEKLLEELLEDVGIDSNNPNSVFDFAANVCLSYARYLQATESKAYRSIQILKDAANELDVAWLDKENETSD